MEGELELGKEQNGFFLFSQDENNKKRRGVEFPLAGTEEEES